MDASQDSECTVDSCQKYDEDFLDATKIFVDRTIVQAHEKIRNDDSTIEDSCPGCEARVDPEYDWPTSEQMSVQAGLKRVKKMMKEWKSEPAMRGWKFYAEFIGMESDGSSAFYRYQVRWSVPTSAYPEPQITVSVFFTMEATKPKYRNCPVDVTYAFEGNAFVHRPKMPFRPKWIYDIFDIKTMMFKSIKF